MVFLETVMRLSAPLIFVALGGFFSERAGVINIALEGLMAVGALTGAIAAHEFGASSLGVVVGMLSGSAFALLYGFLVLKAKANQIVAGTAMNLLASGLAPFICKALYGVTGSTPALDSSVQLSSSFVYMSIPLVLLVHVVTRYTPFGLWIRVSGENPEALRTAGVSPLRVRWVALAISGAFAALGGVTLSIALSSSFSREMTAGRGFMALAALILGKWRPIPAALGCVLFGTAEAAQVYGMGSGNLGAGMQAFLQALPYLVTLGVLAGFVGRARAPRGLGQAL